MIAARFAALQRELQPLVDRFDAAGHRLYLVGGTVRDLLVRAATESDDPHPQVEVDADIDATTTARPDEIKRCLDGWADAIWTQGERFGTIGAMKRERGVGDVTQRVYEITTHRAEVYRSDSRRPEVDFSLDIVADLSRRDFTVNAMAIELTGTDADRHEPEVVDPFDGAADLHARRLRTPLAPEQSFADDPLRMLRAARFITKYHLRPDPQLIAAVQSMVDRLSIVSIERIRDELHKLLLAPAPAEGLRFCAHTGMWRSIVADTELTADVIRLIDAVAHPASPRSQERAIDLRLTRLAALLTESAEPRRELRTLRHSTADVEAVATIVAGCDHILALASGGAVATDGQVRRLVAAVGSRLPEAMRLAEWRDAPGADVHAVVSRVVALGMAEDLTDLSPELDGDAVMRRLGVGAGPEVGAALAFLRDLRLDAGQVGATEAGERLARWWRDRG